MLSFTYIFILSFAKVKNEIKESINILDEQDAHPRRPRSKYAGEMMQTERL